MSLKILLSAPVVSPRNSDLGTTLRWCLDFIVIGQQQCQIRTIQSVMQNVFAIKMLQEPNPLNLFGQIKHSFLLKLVPLQMKHGQMIRHFRQKCPNPALVPHPLVMLMLTIVAYTCTSWNCLYALKQYINRVLHSLLRLTGPQDQQPSRLTGPAQVELVLVYVENYNTQIACLSC